MKNSWTTKEMEMDELQEKFLTNSSQIWTIVSVMVGGFITYISTHALERYKQRIEAQQQKMEQVLIPYCTCIEEALVELRSFNDKLSSKYIVDEWIDKIQSPVQYLKAEKRVYLSEISRKLLSGYETNIRNFIQVLADDYEMCIMQCEEYMCEILSKFPNVEEFIDIKFYMLASLKEQVKQAILRKTTFSFIEGLEGVKFIVDDIEDVKSTTVWIENQDWAICEMIECGEIELVDMKNEISVLLVKYMRENIEEGTIVLNIVNNTESADLVAKLARELEYILEVMIKEIDKIIK